MPGSELTADEARLRRVLRVLGVVFAVLVAGYALQGILGPAEFPFVANSMAKDGMFAALCLTAAADVRRFGWAARLVVIGHVLLVAGLLAMLVAGEDDSVAGSFGSPLDIGVPSAQALLLLWLGLALTVAATLGWLSRRAYRSRHGLRYLSPRQHRTMTALAEVLVMGPGERLTAEEVAGNVDEYLDSFAAKAKRKSRLALSALATYPLLRGRPPYALMSPEDRQRLVEAWFLRDVGERRLPGFLRRPLQSMICAAQQLAFIGYYADPRTASSTGYAPFSQRPGTEEALKRVDHDRPRVRAHTPRDIDAEEIRADVAIVGSGAAGAIVAHELAAQGMEVVVLERGRHVDPAHFTEDERRQFSDLYADGALQMSTDTRFKVLQGMCVGGTTVVNNAVCFDLPGHVLARWNDPDGLDAGIDGDRLRESTAHLRGWLPVRSQARDTPLQAGGGRFAEGVRALGLDRDGGRFGVVDANISDCLGCGYCNFGCPYGKKLSMLETALPRAQQAFGGDRVRILAECHAQRVQTDGARATGVRCELSDGRRLRVRADRVVVSAGALASSLLLQRSGVGGRLAGRGLGFNMGAPMTAEFPERLNAFAGLQISHYLQPAARDGLILETWFNPVGAQSLFMPGWFSEHFRNMRRYDHMACVGSVVGTRRNARVDLGRLGKLRPGMRLRYEPAEDDLRRLVDGLVLIGRILLAAGATRVMPSTFRSLSFTSPEALDDLHDHVRDNTDIELHSSHPQGGNAMSRDPAKGVVDPSFRVHGFENLHVCDASVFPTAITVNPQLTVMALAHMAAQEMAAA